MKNLLKTSKFYSDLCVASLCLFIGMIGLVVTRLIEPNDITNGMMLTFVVTAIVSVIIAESIKDAEKRNTYI